MTRSPGGPRRRSAFTARLQNSAIAGEQPLVLDDMRAAILRGDQPPGTSIPIDAVADFFGVSQIPVREALKILLGEGLVEHVPHVGYSVAKLTFGEFRELYEVRRALEEASLRAAVGCATAEDDEAVRQAHEDIADAARSGDERAYHDASRSFHLALIAPSRMRRLLRMYESAWNLTEPARPMSRLDGFHWEQFGRDHEAMLEAFCARDVDRLLAESDAHYDHLLEGIEMLADDRENFRV
ncbi:MAG: GntR family transcriptional regulator [Aeromicrobium sp.]|uniref:GntR family transcriptional regulator n=1 Tax=Aeromicrobium sp. TaxID=1871063 RepID=UPI0039E232D4